MTFLLTLLVRVLLWLRYRVVLRGVRDVASRGRRGILFLPNHPALVDPVIVMAFLRRPFAPRALADAKQVDRFFIRYLARKAGVIGIPDISKSGREGAAAVERAIDEVAAALRRGENFILYPAGKAYRQRLEDLGASSAVETILRRLPEVRVVLIRTRGLWGSSFSWAGGPPDVARAVKRAFWQLPASLMFFAPRRRVEIELAEPSDLPRQADRSVLNRYLERFYNESAPPRTYVPYTLLERARKGRGLVLPEPAPRPGADELRHVAPGTRQIVAARLAELSGAAEIRDEDRLANDLGLDSLAVAELAAWLEAEFGASPPPPESLQTVADVMLAACGESLAAGEVTVSPPPKRWFEKGEQPPPGPRVSVPPGSTIAEVFLAQARSDPGRPLFADQRSGLRTYRDIVAACMLLQERFRRLGGEYLGIMLPASVAAAVAYLSAIFAGKTPVMVNWTLGRRNLNHAMDLLGVRHIVTAAAMVKRIESGGTDLSDLRDRLVLLEEVRKGIPLTWKLAAATVARLTRRWGCLAKAKVSDTAAVLFTSGSESLPKAVPLTHANILANIRDVTDAVHIGRADRMVGLLPPFHSFGLTATVVLPACAGVPVAYHPNPTEGAALARTIEAYRATLLVGTPTFLGGIARSAGGGELASLRIVVTGAEKCPPRVYEAVARQCPAAEVLEGYGLTECSPIISVNRPGASRAYTIGPVLPSVEYAVVDAETGRRVQAGGGAEGAPARPGVLLVRGPSVFGGYLRYDGPSPFVDFEGKSWYRTGDLIREDAGGVLTFVGRLKRFVKVGGEMISLPAIEEVLERHYPPREAAPGKPPEPLVAVEAAGQAEHAEIVLFAACDIDREEANRLLRQAGLSPLHHIRRVLRVENIPLLGTGKTDYRSLTAMLSEEM